MTHTQIDQLVRHFPQNGIKVLLENDRNVHDLLNLTDNEVVKLLDCPNLRLERTNFIKGNFRNLLADLLYSVPLIGSDSNAKVYLLIEHESEPERPMPLRLLEYSLEVYKDQVATWERRRSPNADLWLDPVITVVFYTGTETWTDVGTLHDLVRMPPRMGPFVPWMQTLYVPLYAKSQQELKTKAGFFGEVLRLVQRRTARLSDFRRLLVEVVKTLESLPPEQQERWRLFLSYIHALVYHEREEPDVRVLQEVIEDSAETAPHKKEIATMKQTYAQVLEAKGHAAGVEVGRELGRDEGRGEGILLGQRAILLDLLQQRFGKVPSAIRTRIETTSDTRKLKLWLRRVLDAPTLAEVGIPPAPPV